MKRYLLVVMVLTSILIVPKFGHAQSNQTDPWTQLNSYAGEVSDSIDNSDNKAALVFLQAFTKEWNKVQNDPSVQLSNVQVEALTAVADTLKTDLQTDADPVELKRISTEFRLAEDALSSKETPLWMSMGNQLVSSFNNVQKDVKAGNDSKFQVDFNQFMDLYQMIYPAMVINVEPEKVMSLESDVLALQDAQTTVIQDRTEYTGQLNQLDQHLREVFQQPSQDVSALPSESINSMMMAIFGLIVATLFYVSWRKYRGTVTPSN